MQERLAEGTTFGTYTIEGMIAGGGMGQVYAARHSVFGSAVALKVLHPSLHADEGWRQRFNEEGLVGTQLKHPHVLSARELVHSEGRIALVVDLVPGGQTLEKVISREFREGIPLVPALQVFFKILQGMDYLHGKGIVHGDLKPENVMIEGDFRRPESWTPKVTDFGTVALIANPVEIDGRAAVVATPRYASPEHLFGVDRVEVRSDVYCLGLLLHFLLTGRHASSAQTVREAAERVMLPVPIVTLVDQPDVLIALFKRTTSVDAEKRHANARELALAVRALLDAVGAEIELPDVAADLATEVDEDRVEQRKGRKPPSVSQASTEAEPMHHGRDLTAEPGALSDLPSVTPTPSAKGTHPTSAKGRRAPVAGFPDADEPESPTEEDQQSPKHTAPPAPVPLSAAARNASAAPDGGVPGVVWAAGGFAVVLILVIAYYGFAG